MNTKVILGAGENYNNYYLGPFVVSSKDGKRSIIDGQQRLTSLTLFLIYLHNLQKELKYEENRINDFLRVTWQQIIQYSS
jgi:uncharacterized protein with ParB-like and HNH nuclease domain